MKIYLVINYFANRHIVNIFLNMKKAEDFMLQQANAGADDKASVQSYGFDEVGAEYGYEYDNGYIWLEERDIAEKDE